MSISEILSVLWHRKLIVVGVLAVAIGVAVGALHLIKSEYQSTSTLAVSPAKPGTSDLVFFQVVNQIMSIYATAAETDTTLTPPGCAPAAGCQTSRCGRTTELRS